MGAGVWANCGTFWIWVMGAAFWTRGWYVMFCTGVAATVEAPVVGNQTCWVGWGVSTGAVVAVVGVGYHTC